MPEVQIADIHAGVEEVVVAIVRLIAQIRVLYASATRNSENVRNVTDPDRLIAAKLYRKNRSNRESICKGVFFDPAWDILVDLYIAGEEGKPMAVSSACVGLGVPSSTAWRWLNRLEAKGLILRAADPGDGRRLFVMLTPSARDSVRSWLRATFP